MTDDLAKLKEAFRREAPSTPRKGAKRLAIERAMAAYDGKYARAVQGTGLGVRLRDTAKAVFETLIGRRRMKLTPALAGGASLAVLTLAIMSATYIQTNLQEPGPGKVELPKPQPAMPDASAPKQPAPARQEAAKRDLIARLRTGEQEKRVVAVPKTRQFANERFVGVTPRKYSLQRAPIALDRPAPGITRDQGRDKFTTITPNPVKIVVDEPVSTFSIDVDTVSYAFVRASLNDNVLPQKDAVRVEELINYFPYDYARPADRATPFKTNVSVFPAPWNPDRKLVHIGIAGFKLQQAEKPRANLVFLLDTSGSMNAPDKLPLVVKSMKLLLETLRPDDTVAIVTYAGRAGVVLEPTAAKDKAKILQALNNLHAGGSTAGGEGIRQAYELAKLNFDKDGVNRVILATDGDFNVGITDTNELKSYIERQRETGITLSVLGFGRGNYNDALMQALAQNGNGNAAYIDTLNEARKVLVEEAGSTLFTIAKDVKLQVEFNPRTVAEYRLIGYETRLLKREDFNNDKVDAGDIGAGHTVTAIYEITPVESKSRAVDPLRYGDARTRPDAGGKADEYAFLKIRYKLPKQETSKLITTPVDRKLEHASLDAAPQEARFATAVAAFGQILRGGRYTGHFSYDDVIALAQGAKGKDEFGYRAEFINLARLAKSAAALQALPPR